MASTSKKKTPLKEAIDQIRAVAGVNEEVATYLYNASMGDVQVAINLYLEGYVPGGTEDNGESSASGTETSPSGSSSTSSQVRSPIPPQQEVLVEDGAYAYTGRFKRPVSVFDAFRDFQVETRRQEEMLSGKEISPKRKSLEDLFRPPLDLMFQGTFQDARDLGAAQKKWLMVNVQNVLEFACQILNRDIWSNTAIRTLIKEQFIFWQVYCDSSEGQRYSAFYNVSNWPYVAVIDPRTGECLQVWNQIEPNTFCDSLLDFLCQHQYDDQPQRKRVKYGTEAPAGLVTTVGVGVEPGDMSTSVDSSSKTTRDPILDAGEDEQLAAAIRASILEAAASKAKVNGTSSSSSSMSSSSESIEKIKLPFEGEAEGENSFMLRYPDGRKEILIVPCSAPIKLMIEHVESKGYVREHIDMVMNFPRRVLTEMEDTTPIGSLTTHHQETVFIELR